MKRLQIMIEEDLDEALSRQAAKEKVSKAALLRRYARERLKPLPPLDEDPIFGLFGLVEGGPNDSQLVDDIVYGPKRRS